MLSFVKLQKSLMCNRIRYLENLAAWNSEYHGRYTLRITDKACAVKKLDNFAPVNFP